MEKNAKLTNLSKIDRYKSINFFIKKFIKKMFNNDLFRSRSNYTVLKFAYLNKINRFQLIRFFIIFMNCRFSKNYKKIFNIDLFRS